MNKSITLLSALPHSRDDVERARLIPHKDYVRAILGTYKTASDDAWIKYQHVLEIEANRLFRKCKQHDVDVVLNAGRSELADAARRSHVVILMGHWKGYEVACNPPDILVNPTELDSPLRMCVERGILAPEDFELDLNVMHIRAARDQVASRLNDAIDRWRDWLPFDTLVGATIDAIVVSSTYGRSHARSLIDDIFGEQNLLPGARLELADGLWRPADIAECFSCEGAVCEVCDFICCTSEYLAEETKCRHLGTTFRADSQLLEPASVFCALGESIPRLSRELDSADDLTAAYMQIAYESDHKCREN